MLPWVYSLAKVSISPQEMCSWTLSYFIIVCFGLKKMNIYVCMYVIDYEN
jgi:hypothetical protein